MNRRSLEIGARRNLRSRRGRVRFPIVITLGESLVVGQASNSTGMPATYPPTDGSVVKFNDSAQWLNMSEPSDDPGSSPIWTNIQDSSYGHSYTGPLTWRLRKLWARKAGLVPCGKSGTTSWDWSTAGSLVSDAVSKIRAAMAVGTPALIVVDQGVNNCGVPTDPLGQTWTQRWSAVVTYIREQCGIPSTVPWIFKQLPATVPTGYDSTKWSNLRTEQSAFHSPGSGIYVITGTDGPYVGAGDSHYNAIGNEKHSRRVYEQYQAAPGPFGTGPVLAGRRGFSGFPSGTTVFGTSTTEGVFGSASTYLSVLVLVRLESVPASLQRICVRVNGNNGFDMRTNSATLQLIAGNGTTSATAPTRTWVSGDVNKMHLICLSVSGTAVFHYFDNAQVSTSTALTGYSPATGKSMVIGSTDAGANPATAFTIMGVAARNSHLTLADYQTICTATKAAGYLALGGITMDRLWVCPVESATPDYWRDQVGTHDLDFQQGDERNLTYASYDPATAQWGW